MYTHPYTMKRMNSC